MGPRSSKEKSDGMGSSGANATYNQDEYLKMLKRRRQRAARQHEEESTQRGKAYEELKKKQAKEQ